MSWVLVIFMANHTHFIFNFCFPVYLSKSKLDWDNFLYFGVYLLWFFSIYSNSFSLANIPFFHKS